MAFKVTLAQVLDEREERVLKQRDLIHRYHQTLVNFTLNIPGEVKDFPLARMGFYQGFVDILNLMETHQWAVLHHETTHGITGSGGYIVVKQDPVAVKKAMRQLETSSPLGRLYDIDVLDTSYRQISGTELGYPKRTCLLCDKEAFVCARSRAHPLDQLVKTVHEILREGVNPQFLCHGIATLLLKATLYEVSASPKPGLVDRFNSGSHQDMDFFTFIDSSLTLPPYFYDMAKRGFRNTHPDPVAFFATLRDPGKIAEERMFQATGGINTHKGIIFSVGLIAAAAGYLVAQGENLTGKNLAQYVAAMTAEVIEKDFGSVCKETARTNGEKLYAKHGVLGIRGEAMNGFPSVINYGLPYFQQGLDRGYSQNHAMLYSLLGILTDLDDTNVLSRQDFQTLLQVKEDAKEILSSAQGDPQKLEGLLCELDNEYVKKMISPGGGADLLIVTLSLWQLEHHIKDALIPLSFDQRLYLP